MYRWFNEYRQFVPEFLAELSAVLRGSELGRVLAEKLGKGWLLECLTLELTRDTPIAKVVTDAFLDRLERPQWQLEKSLEQR